MCCQSRERESGRSPMARGALRGLPGAAPGAWLERSGRSSTGSPAVVCIVEFRGGLRGRPPRARRRASGGALLAAAAGRVESPQRGGALGNVGRSGPATIHVSVPLSAARSRSGKRRTHRRSTLGPGDHDDRAPDRGHDGRATRLHADRACDEPGPQATRAGVNEADRLDLIDPESRGRLWTWPTERQRRAPTCAAFCAADLRADAERTRAPLPEAAARAGTAAARHRHEGRRLDRVDCRWPDHKLS